MKKKFRNIRSAKQLELVARRDLENKTLLQVVRSIADTDAVARKLSKSGVGYVVEDGYLGIGRNSTKGPDVAHLGVEVKTSALRLGKDGKLRSKEPVSLNIINYMTEYANRDIRKSSFYKKNKCILFVFYIHEKDKPRSSYRIKYVFLWRMDDRVLRELSQDYAAILQKIRAGKAHEIHQSDHRYLTLCPKHNGNFKDPKEKTSKTKQPFNNKWAEVRAFRLKCVYVNEIIRRELKKRGTRALAGFI